MELRTKRLILTELTSSDLDDIHDLHSLPEVDRYNTLGIPERIEQTESLLSDWIEKQNAAPRMSFIFCVRLIGTNQFLD